MSFANKSLCSQSYGFLVVMYGYENWTIKKAECWRIDAFELRFWRRLASPLDFKEIQPVHPTGNQPWTSSEFIARADAEAEAPVLWPPDAKGQPLLLWKMEGRRRRGWQRMRWLDGFTDSMDMNLSKLQGTVKDREAWWTIVHGIIKSWTWLSDCRTTTVPFHSVWSCAIHPVSFHPVTMFHCILSLISTS